MTIHAYEPFAGRSPLLHAVPKLTAAQREEIGFLRGDGIPSRDLAATYSVSASVIRNITPRERP